MYYVLFILDCIETDCRPSCQKESDVLPKPRQVSLVISKDKDEKDRSLNNMAIYFGQFLDHDVSLSPEQELDDCCTHDDDECMKIELPTNDPFYSPFNQTCLHLTRSVPHCSSGYPPTMNREQQNVITSFLDASNIYGSDADRGRRIRTMVRGKLKVNDGLLPEEELQRCNVPISGDVRAMENPNLASLHALFMREHNRICDALWNLENWTEFGKEEDCDNDHCDELIYQNARRILIAEWQNIIYSEWLPHILGRKRVNEFNLDLNKSNVRYNNSIDPSILASFSTAAFRFGHSMINGMFTKKNPTNQKHVKDISLSDTFFNRDEYQGKGVEQLLAGLGEKKAQARDRYVSNELTRFLFKPTGQQENPSFGQDLIARNIARGRDHGIPSFATFYSKVGPNSDANKGFNCWGELPETFDNSTWELLKKVYIHPKDIDLFVGGLLEKNTVGGGVLGHTFGWIVAEQFRRLKEGDRFFLTHTGRLYTFY